MIGHQPDRRHHTDLNDLAVEFIGYLGALDHQLSSGAEDLEVWTHMLAALHSFVVAASLRRMKALSDLITDLAVALRDIKNGSKPAFLLPRRKSGRPKEPLTTSHLKGVCAVCLNILVWSGKSPDEAAAAIAKDLQLLKVQGKSSGKLPSPITAKQIRNWNYEIKSKRFPAASNVYGVLLFSLFAEPYFDPRLDGPKVVDVFLRYVARRTRST